MESTNELLKISDIAREFNLDRTTVFRWIEKGYLKSMQLPTGTHRISRKELGAFLKMQKINKKEFNIILIDDEQFMLDMLQDILKTLKDIPIRILPCLNGLKALLAMGDFRPDLIIIDYGLDDVDGLTIVKRIRETQNFKEVPIVLISGIVDDVKVKELGIKAFLKKPFSKKDIEKVVRDCIVIH
ncbi:MAG: response regulator [Chitinivibrionales bacterium]|nr:response regulator [Chitinivibrionales bacterium]